MCILKIKRALTKALKRNTKKIELNQERKIILFSDLHRGVGDYADDFMHNVFVFANALNYYLREEFIYIEIGDGDELYENRKLVDIVRTHGNIYSLMNEFHKEDRFVYIWGNHNLQLRNRKLRDKALEEAWAHIPGLFRDIEVYETVLLGDRIFLFHGHQGDPINDAFVPLGRFMVRNFWRPLQTGFGVKDLTSPAQNIRKRNRVEDAILEWARENKMVTIAGHTHRAMFYSLSKQQKMAGEKGEPYYFNCGCGLHPRYITCLEIEEMTIRLVKWHLRAEPGDESRLRIGREVLKDCEKSLDDILAEVNSSS